MVSISYSENTEKLQLIKRYIAQGAFYESKITCYYEKLRVAQDAYNKSKANHDDDVRTREFVVGRIKELISYYKERSSITAQHLKELQ